MTKNNSGDAQVALFCPDFTETNTIRRAQGFIDRGCEVTVFGFRRGRYNADFASPWACVYLGKTADGRYWQRLWATARALPLLLREAPRLRDADAFYARNLDQLLLAIAARWLLRSTAPIAYEVLDVPSVMTGRRPVSMILRAVERFCLRRITVLVLSSPGFHSGYFASTQRYDGDWLLLENKLHPAAVTSHRRPTRNAVDRDLVRRSWVIGYFGLIRGNATIDLIGRVAKRLGDRVRFRFRGVLTTVDKRRFETMLRRCDNVTFGGAYENPRDLDELYGGVDFAWALDLEHAEHNSRWLLPCRFYEAGFFGVPCIAVREFEVGRLIDRLGVGWTFSEPLEESLVRFFESLTPEAYGERRRRLEDQPRDCFVAGQELADLCARLRLGRRAENGGHPQRSASSALG